VLVPLWIQQYHIECLLNKVAAANNCISMIYVRRGRRDSNSPHQFVSKCRFQISRDAFRVKFLYKPNSSKNRSILLFSNRQLLGSWRNLMQLNGNRDNLTADIAIDCAQYLHYNKNLIGFSGCATDWIPNNRSNLWTWELFWTVCAVVDKHREYSVSARRTHN
jgi:hypothetical protein